MCENEARKKFCSIYCGVAWHNTKRKVALGWIKFKPKMKHFCKWCGTELEGQHRKFCGQSHAFKWQAKYKPEHGKAACRKYYKKNGVAIHRNKNQIIKNLPDGHPRKILSRLRSGIGKIIRENKGIKRCGTIYLTNADKSLMFTV